MTFEQWWDEQNRFSTDDERLDHTVWVLSAPFQACRKAAEAAWNAALDNVRPSQPPAPQDVPAQKEQP